MLYREIMAVCSEIHTKHINTPCGQNVELLNVKLVVHIGFQRLKQATTTSFHALLFFSPVASVQNRNKQNTLDTVRPLSA